MQPSIPAQGALTAPRQQTSHLGHSRLTNPGQRYPFANATRRKTKYSGWEGGDARQFAGLDHLGRLTTELSVAPTKVGG